MDERAAAQAFEDETAAVLAGAHGTVRGTDRDEPIHVAEQLRALAGEWGRQISPALQREIASLAEGASISAQLGRATGRFWRRRVLWYSTAMTAAATLLILAIPSAREGIARQLYRVLDVFVVGPNTEVVRPDASTPGEIAATLHQFDRQLASGRMWQFRTAYGGFAGTVPPGSSPALQRVDRLDVLASLTSMQIRLPKGLHRGTAPTFNHALVAPDGLLFLFLGSGDNEILLVQAPVGAGRSMSYSRVVGTTDKQGRLSTYSPPIKTEHLFVDGQPLVWDPDNTSLIPNSSALRWEREGVSYSLMGHGLTRDEAVQLFLGLRPSDAQPSK